MPTTTNPFRSLEKEFSSSARNQGLGYFREGQYEIFDCDDNGLVEGSSCGYDISLFFEASSCIMWSACFCLMSDKGILCKHAYCLLLELDSDGTLNRLQKSSHANWTSQTEAVFFDDTTVILAGFNEQRNVLRANNLPFIDSIPSKQATSKKPPSALDSLDALLAPSPVDTSHHWSPAVQSVADRILHYSLIGVIHDSGSRSLALQLKSQKTNRSGRASNVFRDENAGDFPIHPSLDTADRRVLEILQGSAQRFENDYYYYSRSNTDPVDLSPHTAAALLEAACATGRCTFGDDPARDPLCIWDSSEPWQVQLELRGNPGDDEFTLHTSVVRKNDVFPIHNEHGVFFTRDALICADANPPQTLHIAPVAPNVANWVARIPPSQPLTLPASDVSALIARLISRDGLPQLQLPKHLQPNTREAAPVGVLRLIRPDNTSQLEADLHVAYGDETLSLTATTRGILDTTTHTVYLRQPEAEDALAQRLTELGLSRVPAPPADLDDPHSTPPHRVALAPDQLAHVVSELRNEDWRVEADNRPLRVSSGDLNIRVSSGIDWFDLEGQADFDDQAALLGDLLGVIQRGETFIPLGDGSVGLIPEAWLKRYAHLTQLGEATDTGRRLNANQIGLLDALLSAMPEARFDRTVATARRKLAKLSDIRPAKAPRGFGGTLRDYQAEGVGWLEALAELGFNGCLADDMGLGKTIQVLAWLQRRRDSASRKNTPSIRPSLVVVPKSLIDNWIAEATRFTPRLAVLDHTGAQRFEPGGPACYAHFAHHDLILTTYGTLRRDIATLHEHPFDCVVLDEAQAIKNEKTAGAKAARLLQSKHKLAVSGTPVENHLGDIISLFNFLNPGMLAGANHLLKTPPVSQTRSNEADNDTPNASPPTDEHDPLNAAKILSHAVRPFILRRTKKQVAPELPDRNEETLYCTMEPKQAAYYKRLAAHYRNSLMKQVESKGLKRSKIQVLEALLRLRQAACHPALVDPKQSKLPSAKLDLLFERLDTLRAQGSKALVFSQFVKLLDQVRLHLDAKDIPYAYLDGRTRKRQDVVDRFQNDPECPLMLISLKAGGTGLNLTAAEYVFLLDPWWNPAVEAQAIDRAHRIGQQNTVFANRLITRDTVEEKVLALQATKRDLADAILGDPASIMQKLSLDDLAMLLG
ncbi:MAG: DEAD/DEAH box helicase [Algisphaera sp.]